MIYLKILVLISLFACCSCSPSAPTEPVRSKAQIIGDQRLYGGSLARIRIPKRGNARNQSTNPAVETRKHPKKLKKTTKGINSEIKSEPIYIRVRNDGNHEVINEIRKEDKTWVRSRLKDGPINPSETREAGDTGTKKHNQLQEPETKQQIDKLRSILQRTEVMINELERK